MAAVSGLGQPGYGRCSCWEDFGVSCVLGIVEWALKKEVVSIWWGAQWGQHVEVRAAAARAAGGAGVLWEAHVGQNQCPGGPAGRWGVQMGCPGTEPGNSNQQPSISLEAFPAPPPTPHMPFLLT